MAHLSSALLDHVANRHGIASSAVLRDIGLSEHDIRDLRAAGSLERVLHGAYRVPAVPLDELARCAALCAAHPEAVISGPTAGRLWGFRRLPPDRRIHAIFPPASQPTLAAWVVPYRTGAIRHEDRVVRSDGIVVTSRARTALDLARSVGPADLLSIIEQAMHDGRLDEGDLRSVAVDWLSPQRPWLRRFLEILNHRTPGGPAESHAEVVLGDALAAAGVTGLVRQFEIDLPGYGPARFDLAVPNLRWAIEVDAHPTHRESAGKHRDHARDVAAASVGWSVTRVGPPELREDLAATVQTLSRRFRLLSSAG